MAQALTLQFGNPDDIQKQREAAAIVPSTDDKFEQLRQLVGNLQSQISAHNRDIATLKEKHNQEVSALKEEIATLKEKHNQEVSALKEEIATQKELHNQEVSALKEEIATLKKDISTIQDKYQRKFHDHSLRNFWQFYLRAAVSNAQIKKRNEVQKASAGQVLLEITAAKDKYETWAKRKNLPTFLQVETLAKPCIDRGNKAVHQSNVDDMFEELVYLGPQLHDLYKQMWDFVAETEQNWGKWDDMMVKFKERPQ